MQILGGATVAKDRGTGPGSFSILSGHDLNSQLRCTHPIEINVLVNDTYMVCTRAPTHTPPTNHYHYYNRYYYYYNYNNNNYYY